MSDSMLVFVEGSKLPTVDALRDEVKTMGLDLEAWDEALTDITGYWPGKIKDEEAGFEFFAAKPDPQDLEDWEIDEEELSGRDYCVELAFHTELDVEATTICAVALCKLSDGITFNDDEVLDVNAGNCMQWAKDEMGYDFSKER